MCVSGWVIMDMYMRNSSKHQCHLAIKSKEEAIDQESIRSSTSPEPRQHMGK